MGHKVFVSYKFSDALKTREALRTVLGNDGQYYNGEKGFEALECADETIKEYLKDMIFNTSVTVVVISPNVILSNWVDWEIRYSLRMASRDGITSHRNGIVCVIQNNKDIYGNMNVSWAMDYNGKYRKDIFPRAIINNLQTTFIDPYYQYLAALNGSSSQTPLDYCVVVSESSFRANPTKYIEEAYNRAHDDLYKVVVDK